jgi:hypothetical protein
MPAIGRHRSRERVARGLAAALSRLKLWRDRLVAHPQPLTLDELAAPATRPLLGLQAGG